MVVYHFIFANFVALHYQSELFIVKHNNFQNHEKS